MATQLDIIRRQAEAAARNAAARAEGNLRRDASLVNQASRWAGRTMAEGEAALRARSRGLRQSEGVSRETMATCAPPVSPAPDGYVRRSPVQSIHVMAGYRRRQVLRVVAAVVMLAAACVGLYLLNRLGVFGR